MTLKTYNFDQRSDEWHEARRGMVTASIVGQLVTTKPLGAIDFPCPSCEAAAGESCRHKRTGAPIATTHADRAEVARNDTSPPTLVLADTETTRKLAALLAAERIAGVDPDGELSGRDIWRGQDSEPYARQKYAEHYAVEVTECGFMVDEQDGYRIGFSPDGLVGDDGLIEIKAPRQRGHLLTAVNGVVPAEHMAQIQTGLLVSGRAWCDFVSFHGGMRLWVKRVTPDPDWFLAIHAAAAAFEQEVERLVAEYLAAVEPFPMTEPLPDPNLVELKL